MSKVLQQVRGVSSKVAEAVTTKYPTVYSLYDSWSRCLTTREAELMLAVIETGNNSSVKVSRKRQVGQALSTKIYNIFNGKDPAKVVS